ncbi:FGGY family carbohydrate kinase [Devosia sp. CN2-171]|uniref:FGGY family carbohydrate kinase n=1 Tax=Devosia sp. CN2-171 TaxID=3400909 RepID=UPI003BF7EA3F
MSNGLILAIDQGTTNTKALAFDAGGRVVVSASVPMAVSYPQPGWAEQSATDIWQSVSAVIAKVVASTGPDMDAVAISNQRETIVVWDARTGVPIAPAILWQCRRSAPKCAAIRAAGHAPEIEARTGLGLDPLFPAAKIAWILDNVPGARDAAISGSLRAGTIDTWLLWKLTGGEHATDHSNASRTQLFNTEALTWDPALARIFDVPLTLLPRVRNSDSAFGTVAAGTCALAAGTPVHAMVGDSHAALYGHGVREPGTVKATYGTGSSLMTLTTGRIASRSGLSSTIAWSTSGGLAYALEGNISVSGQAVAFMGELLGLGDPSAVAELAATVTDSNGVVFVPALVGLGAPYWDPDARGIVAGLALGTRPAHLARAAVESVAFQVADVFSAMETDLCTALTRLSADGGAARNDMLMQFQADLIGRPVLRGDLPEVSAAGAAMLAATGLGRSPPSIGGHQREFLPTMSAAQRADVLGRWLDGVGRVLNSDRTTN